MKQMSMLTGLWKVGGMGTREIENKEERKYGHCKTFNTLWLLNITNVKNIYSHIGSNFEIY